MHTLGTSFETTGVGERLHLTQMGCSDTVECASISFSERSLSFLPVWDSTCSVALHNFLPVLVLGLILVELGSKEERGSISATRDGKERPGKVSMRKVLC